MNLPEYMFYIFIIVGFFAVIIMAALNWKKGVSNKVFFTELAASIGAFLLVAFALKEQTKFKEDEIKKDLNDVAKDGVALKKDVASKSETISTKSAENSDAAYNVNAEVKKSLATVSKAKKIATIVTDLNADKTIEKKLEDNGFKK